MALHRAAHRSLQPVARPILSQHRLRSMHPCRRAGRGHPRRALVVGAGGGEGMRLACRATPRCPRPTRRTAWSRRRRPRRRTDRQTNHRRGTDRSPRMNAPLDLERLLPQIDHRHLDASLLLPVQYVAREGDGLGHQPRTVWGRIARGQVQSGDKIRIHPSGESAEVVAVRRAGVAVRSGRGSHLHPARGGGWFRAPGLAVLWREGFLRRAAPGGKGVQAAPGQRGLRRPAAVCLAACRYRA
ncbi:hypothetical protein THICB3640016 [Thiomonas sp. CB3]|nr:hypothetical protein THICB3640016 [Thiomonas sp. CB3]